MFHVFFWACSVDDVDHSSEISIKHFVLHAQLCASLQYQNLAMNLTLMNGTGSTRCCEWKTWKIF